MRTRNISRLGAALAFASLALVPMTMQAQVSSANTGERAPVALQQQVAPSVAAPQVSPPSVPAAVSVAPLGAQPRGVALGLHRVAADSATPPPAPADNDRGNTGLMLAGAAAMIVGAVVGDDAGTLIIVGGAVIGFYGLYRFLTN